MNLRWRLLQFTFIVGLFLLPGTANAESCTPGTLATIKYTSCSIGAVQFDFGYIWASQGVVDHSVWPNDQQAWDVDLASLTFTPFQAGNEVGFTVAGLPASASDAAWIERQSYASIQFLVSGGPISELHAFLINPSASFDPALATYNGSSGALAQMFFQFQGCVHPNFSASYLVGSSGLEDIQSASALWPQGCGYPDFGMAGMETVGHSGGSGSADGFGFSFTVAPVSEPTSLVLLGTGIVGWLARRKK